MTGRYVFGQGTDQPVMWYSGTGVGGRRFLLSNPQGSIIGVSNVSGTLLAANTYDEFGVPGASNLGMFQYTGQLWLASAGLYYYKARIYSPTLGRFLQTDPIGYGDGANWYNYVHGDPVNGTDPSGLDEATALSGFTVTALLGSSVGGLLSGGTGGGSGTGSYGGAYQWSGRNQHATTVSTVVVTARKVAQIQLTTFAPDPVIEADLPDINFTPQSIQIVANNQSPGKRKKSPTTSCPGLSGQPCGAPTGAGGVNPDYPDVCPQCLDREGKWPYGNQPPPDSLKSLPPALLLLLILALAPVGA